MNRVQIETSLSDQPSKTDQQHKDRCWILELPEEMFLTIIQFSLYETKAHIPSRDPFLEPSLYQSSHVGLELAKTCKRFYNATIPLIYYSVLLMDPFKTKKKISQLLNLVTANPMLSRYCRELKLALPDATNSRFEYQCRELDFNNIKELARNLPNVGSLSILGGFTNPYRIGNTWNVLETCVESMPHLERVCLSMDTWIGSNVVKLMHLLPKSSLKTLNLYGVAGRVGTFSADEVEVCDGARFLYKNVFEI